jgi:pimeloyl-ACP methyl ester carboxylesterase
VDNSPHISDLVNVNGINLQYLDWDGSGKTLLFLTGLGLSADSYEKFAPRFIDNFRVVALTRRREGDSDYPEAGYEADTLT